MTVEEMIYEAHRQARMLLGHWDGLLAIERARGNKALEDRHADALYEAVVAQKLGMIVGGIIEFEITVSGQSGWGHAWPSMELALTSGVEKLADVELRVFDLCGHFGIRLPEDLLSAGSEGVLDWRIDAHATAHAVSHLVGRAMKQKSGVGNRQLAPCLKEVAALAARWANVYCGAGTLTQSIERKLEEPRSGIFS